MSSFVLLDGLELSAALDRHGLTIDQVSRRMGVDAHGSFDPVDVAEVLIRAAAEGSAIVSRAFLVALVTDGLRPVKGLGDRLTLREL